MTSAFQIEICINSYASLLAAQSAGGLGIGIDRVELCSNLEQGGTTPSAGLIKNVVKDATVPVHVLIRPRAGDFFYSENELQIMEEDIRMCKELGVNAVVFGALKKADEEGQREVDVEACRRFMKAAEGMRTTFHRAIDDACSEKSLEDIIKMGFDRILTSGGEDTAASGVMRLRRFADCLKERKESEFGIMAGAGVNAGNVEELHQVGGITQFHASCTKVVPHNEVFESLFAAPTMVTSTEKVKALVAAVRQLERKVKNQQLS